MAIRSVLVALMMAALAGCHGAQAACPSLAESDVPASCKAKDSATVCGACVDQLFAVIQGKLGPTTPCSQDLGSCVGGAAPAFLEARANVNALLSCNTDETAARIQPRLQCSGEKPTVAQLSSQLRSVGR